MKKIYFLSFLALFFYASFIRAQSYDDLDINNIKARINAGGDLFGNPGPYFSGFEVPINSGTHTIYLASLWIGGVDSQSNLHLAAQTYRQTGTDFFPGPVMDSTAYSISQDSLWNRVWKINKSTIDSFKLGLFGSIPQIISDWPANGDTSLGQASKLAPYVDVNSNNTYDPANGDYPIIRGDQAIYFLINDDRNAHTESGGQKFGIEIHGLAYAFNCTDSAFYNTVFLHYDIINRSANIYSNLRTGFWNDFDLGGANDDYIASDSALNMFYAYNGDNLDSDYVGAKGYGPNPPAQGVLGLTASAKPRFLYYHNDWGVTGNPTTPQHFYNYMNGKWKDSVDVTYGGDGYGDSSLADFMFSGDPVAPSGWTENSEGITPGDRRGVGSYGPFTLSVADTQSLDLAFVFGRDYTGTNPASVTVLKQRCTAITNEFLSNTTPCGGYIITGEKTDNSLGNNVLLYPNPATSIVNIQLGQTSGNSTYELFDIRGNLLKKGSLNNAHQINIQDLKKGLYLIKIADEENVYIKRIIKQ